MDISQILTYNDQRHSSPALRPESRLTARMSFKVETVSTTPFEGQKLGTSGLRKRSFMAPQPHPMTFILTPTHQGSRYSSRKCVGSSPRSSRHIHRHSFRTTQKTSSSPSWIPSMPKTPLLSSEEMAAISLQRSPR